MTFWYFTFWGKRSQRWFSILCDAGSVKYAYSRGTFGKNNGLRFFGKIWVNLQIICLRWVIFRRQLIVIITLEFCPLKVQYHSLLMELLVDIYVEMQLWQFNAWNYYIFHCLHCNWLRWTIQLLEDVWPLEFRMATSSFVYRLWYEIVKLDVVTLKYYTCLDIIACMKGPFGAKIILIIWNLKACKSSYLVVWRLV